MRVLRADLDRLLRHASDAQVSASSFLRNKREGLETLNLELQERRVKRELARLAEDDAEAERRRKSTARAEEQERERALEETRLQGARDAAERRVRQREQEEAEERRGWTDAWVSWGLNALPKDAPRETELNVAQAVEETLAKLGPEQPPSTTRSLVHAAIDKALRPWQRRKGIEQAVQSARKELPVVVRTLSDYFEPTEWEVRAMQAAREAIAELPADASYEEMRAAAVQAGKQIATHYEGEQAQARAQVQAEREKLDRESMKRFLVSLGADSVSGYLRKLHSDGDIFEEDLERASELESLVRKALERKLTGVEGIDTAQRFARELVDSELVRLYD
jgi:hypothetical protein